MVKLSRLVALAALAAVILAIGSPLTVRANGAASTRNILLGSAAAALLIIDRNKNVHEHYAQDAATEASLAEQRNDAQAAYRAEKKAYAGEAALAADLRKEVAYQHDIIGELQREVTPGSAAPSGSSVASDFAASTTLVESTPVGGQQPVAVTSYGWGTI
ncbi:MAG TPA: hypothetical protein VEJ20_05315 [Candidatus Eremiobacteraceae bacterium]|nr:hypothetical protein [Candidatus Eremiobacteraceae bacterium]